MQRSEIASGAHIYGRLDTPDNIEAYLRHPNVLGVVNFGSRLKSSGVDFPFPYLSVETGEAKENEFLELWLSSAKVENERLDGFQFAFDQENLFGCITFPEEPDRHKLEELTSSVYLKLFSQINSLGYPHLFRMWNYIPQINKTEELERYQAFCLGRSIAFSDYYRNTDRVLPAATGISKKKNNSIELYFLSHRHQNIIHLENPRQVPAYQYPARYGPRPPSFARGSCLLRSQTSYELYISGTASILGSETVHKDDPVKQCETTLENIRLLIDKNNLKAYHITGGHGLRDLENIKIYYRRQSDLPVIKTVCEGHFGASQQKAYINVDICRSDLLVEIEGVVRTADVKTGTGLS